MTRKKQEAKSRIEYLLKISSFVFDERDKEALEAAIQALTQEPCELLIIKSDILLHQDDRKKWTESIKREKESGVIILPPYFEPLLVPNDIEINIEQEPCDDAISRDAVNTLVDELARAISDERCHIPQRGRDTGHIMHDILELPSVTQKPIECDDAISRDIALVKMSDYVASGYAESIKDFGEVDRTKKCDFFRKCAVEI